MMKLDEPPCSFEQALEECQKGASRNRGLLRRLASSRADLLAVEGQYSTAALAGDLYTIPPIAAGMNANALVINALSKSDLVKFYDQYFVPNKKPARKIYDALINAAKEKCPFCGGIGTPRNLDHFLPKANFPQFSVLPSNLVPSCRDCNMDGKAHNFARSAEEQLIQPYIDCADFFSVQWIFSRYHHDNNGEPGEFEYFVDPPAEWSLVDKNRASRHFDAFSLARRYATKAAEALGTVMRQIDTMRDAGLNGRTIEVVLLQPGVDSAIFANHWQKGMYQALIEHLKSISVEYCAQE